MFDFEWQLPTNPADLRTLGFQRSFVCGGNEGG